MPIYNRGGAAQTNRTGVTARIDYRYILPKVNIKLGSNQLRRRDTAMMQYALITCASYIIWTSYQPTTAHHFIMEKCVNVQKSPMKGCDAVSEYSYEKCE